MTKEERLKLENELLLTKSKTQMINLYLDELDELKKQKEINQKAIEYIKEKQKIQYKFALSHIECDDLLEILEDKEV